MTRIVRKRPDRFLYGSRYLDRRRYHLHPRHQSLWWCGGERSPPHQADPAMSGASVESGSLPLDSTSHW